jgi:hypothetical protein
VEPAAAVRARSPSGPTHRHGARAATRQVPTARTGSDTRSTDHTDPSPTRARHPMRAPRPVPPSDETSRQGTAGAQQGPAQRPHVRRDRPRAPEGDALRGSAGAAGPGERRDRRCGAPARAPRPTALGPMKAHPAKPRTREHRAPRSAPPARARQRTAGPGGAHPGAAPRGTAGPENHGRRRAGHPTEPHPQRNCAAQRCPSRSAAHREDPGPEPHPSHSGSRGPQQEAPSRGTEARGPKQGPGLRSRELGS